MDKPPNPALLTYARALLLRAEPMVDPLVVERFLAAPRYASFVAAFDRQLANKFAEFRQDRPAPVVFPELLANPAPSVFQDLRDALPDAAPGAAANPPPEASEPSKTVDATETTGSPQPDALPSPPLAAAASPAPETDPDHGTETMNRIASPQASGTGNPVEFQSPISTTAFRLPNARAGEPYRHKLALDSAAVPVFLEITLPPGLGLSVDLENAEISGMPLAASEYSVALLYHLAGEDQAKARRATATLLVNPDPRSLWKDQPSNQADPYWKPDSASGYMAGPSLRMVAASKRGRSHAHVGSFRDDHFTLACDLDSGWHWAVVADGAGSAKHSRRGAQIVCEEAARHLRQCLEGPLGQEIIEVSALWSESSELKKPADVAESKESADSTELAGAAIPADSPHALLHNKLHVALGGAAHQAVAGILQEIKSRPELAAQYNDFATTALVAACRRFPFGTLCAAYWVGDGAVGVYSKTDGITLLGASDGGEYSGQTRFLDISELSREALLRRTRFTLSRDFSGLVLMTDGVSDPKFETEAKLGQRAGWDALWQEWEQAIGLSTPEDGMQNRLLEWLDFWSTGNHDDRTLAIIF